MNTRVAALFIGGSLAFSLAPAAHAQAIIGVNTLVDAPDFDLLDGVCDCDNVAPGPQCSLRAAVQNANQLGGWVIINLGGVLYNLTFGGTDDASVAGDLDVFAGTLSRLEIQGAPGTIISGAGLIAGGTPDRILHITATVTNTCELIITNVTISDGAGVNFGAGLNQQAGKVTLSNVWFDNCTAGSDGGGVHTTTTQQFNHNGGGYSDCDANFVGGGIMIDASPAAQVLLSNLQFFNCDSGNHGGAVRNGQNAVATMSNCSVGAANTSGSGGGISNRGTLTVNDSNIAANFASGTGGGVANNIGATLTMNRCTINQNQANTGGGLNNASTATLTDCTIRLNTADTGGGISNAAAAATPLRVFSSTIAFNFATGNFGGGGYRGFGAMEMVNSTMSGNAAQSGFGGAIYFDGGLQTVEINASTIANNFALNGGGALFNDNGFGATQIIFRNSILSSNTIGGGANNNFIGAFPPVSNGFNLDSDGSCGFATASDINGVNPLLGPLQNNGGPTETRELLPGSPAINTGDCTTIAGNALTTDQRGFLRISPCDRGAFEANAPPPPPNDTCALAANVLPGSFPFNNFGANTDGPPELPCGFSGLPGQDSDVWFNFVAPCNGTVTISVTPVPPSNPDRLLAVYDSCPVSGVGPAPIACASSTGGSPATATIIVVAGQMYVIRAGMPAGNQGDSILDITLVCDCPADIVISGAVDVNDMLAVINGWGACPAPCPPSCAADIAPVPPAAGDCMVDVNDLLTVINAWGPCP